MRDLPELEQHRGRLWRLGYRMTGLITVATNKSRDLLRRRKTGTYVGPRLPSPVAETELDELTPDARYGQAESLSYACLIALEALSSTQRACVILRDVMGYSVCASSAA